MGSMENMVVNKLTPIFPTHVQVNNLTRYDPFFFSVGEYASYTSTTIGTDIYFSQTIINNRSIISGNEFDWTEELVKRFDPFLIER